MGTGTAAVARGPLARWSSLRIDPATATLRPFLAAYLVVLGLSITMLPVVRVTGVTDEWPRGLLTAATGLVVMWLGLLPPRRSTTLLHLVGLPQVVVGIVMMLGGLLVAGFMLALVGSAVVLLPVLDGRPVNRTAARGDVLTYLLLIVLAFQGVAIASGLDGASRLVERADLSPLAVGTVLAVLGLGGIAAWWVGATAIGSLATIGGGLALFVLAAISAAGLGPALWILSGATYLRIGKPRSLRAAGVIFFGSGYRMFAGLPGYKRFMGPPAAVDWRPETPAALALLAFCLVTMSALSWKPE